MINIILCGGRGTRLWPISRTLLPKQFVKLFDDKSLFQLTVERNTGVCNSQFIVSNTEQYFLATGQLEELNKTNNKYLLEPVGRNTAPAVALACLMLDHDEVVLVSPSDHLINNHIEYLKVLGKAEKEAKKGSLVTFGIVPDFAETGFGYIEISDNFEKNRVFDVQAFHEKPTVEIATEYLEKRSYYWNSGMYCFKVGVFLGELKKYSPKIYEASVSALKGLSDSNMIRIKDQDMSNIPEDSIDCAVMEKSSKVKVIHSDIGWSDVGIFETLFDALPKDKNGNNLNEKHIALDSYNNLVYGSDRYIATIDIENCIIVDTGDALLVSKQGSSQKVKKIVKELGKSTDLHNIHLTAHRPWGTFTILEDSNKYKIKRIVVNPGNRLSLQKHYHRNEHWVVVSGTATVTVGDETRFVRPNESTYIKMGELHRLSNEGKIPVVMIEVQVGEYMKEDDIVRVDDDFNR